MDAFKKLKENKQQRLSEYEKAMTKGINDYARAVQIKDELRRTFSSIGHTATVATLDELWQAVCECIPPDFIDEYEAIKAERMEKAAEAAEEKVM